jgi:hypothetical protein
MTFVSSMAGWWYSQVGRGLKVSGVNPLKRHTRHKTRETSDSGVEKFSVQLRLQLKGLVQSSSPGIYCLGSPKWGNESSGNRWPTADDSCQQLSTSVVWSATQFPLMTARLRTNDGLFSYWEVPVQHMVVPLPAQQEQRRFFGTQTCDISPRQRIRPAFRH